MRAPNFEAVSASAPPILTDFHAGQWSELVFRSIAYAGQPRAPTPGERRKFWGRLLAAPILAVAQGRADALGLPLSLNMAGEDGAQRNAFFAALHELGRADADTGRPTRAPARMLHAAIEAIALGHEVNKAPLSAWFATVARAYSTAALQYPAAQWPTELSPQHAALRDLLQGCFRNARFIGGLLSPPIGSQSEVAHDGKVVDPFHMHALAELSGLYASVDPLFGDFLAAVLDGARARGISLAGAASYRLGSEIRARGLPQSVECGLMKWEHSLLGRSASPEWRQRAEMQLARVLVDRGVACSELADEPTGNSYAFRAAMLAQSERRELLRVGGKPGSALAADHSARQPRL